MGSVKSRKRRHVFVSNKRTSYLPMNRAQPSHLPAETEGARSVCRSDSSEGSREFPPARPRGHKPAPASDSHPASERQVSVLLEAGARRHQEGLRVAYPSAPTRLRGSLDNRSRSRPSSRYKSNGCDRRRKYSSHM